MTYIIDPERNEVRLLRPVTSWKGKRVLEIGCGDGRLTRRLASLGAHIVGIDPDRSLVVTARKALSRSLRPRVRYEVGKAGRLRFSGESFDVVVFSWSL